MSIETNQQRIAEEAELFVSLFYRLLIRDIILKIAAGDYQSIYTSTWYKRIGSPLGKSERGFKKWQNRQIRQCAKNYLANSLNIN